jgi:hypothetical protein
MLEGKARSSSAHEITQWRTFILSQGAIKLQVEVHALQSHDMGEQMLGVEPRLLDTLLAEKLGCPFEDIQQRHHGR